MRWRRHRVQPDSQRRRASGLVDLTAEAQQRRTVERTATRLNSWADRAGSVVSGWSVRILDTGGDGLGDMAAPPGGRCPPLAITLIR
jgi:hypothetical protein